MKTEKSIMPALIICLSALLFLFGINMRQILHDPILGVRIGNIMTLFGLSMILMMVLIYLWTKAENKMSAEVKYMPEIYFFNSVALSLTLFSFFFFVKMILIILVNPIISMSVDEKILIIIHQTLISKPFWSVLFYFNFFFLVSTYFVMKKNKK